MGSILIIKDDNCLDFVAQKMKGQLLLDDGASEENDMEEYKTHSHLNIFIDEGEGFLCLSFHDSFVVVHYAWHKGTRSTHKQMVRLGKDLYKQYTISKGWPIYYTGIKNFYKNHSRQIEKNLWVFEPKEYD